MSDSNASGTGDPGTQAVDEAAASTETANAGTPSEQATPQTPADSQPSERTTDPIPPIDATGKQGPPPALPDANTANPWESDQNPYRKRFNDTLSHAQKLYQERQQYDRQIQEYQQKLSTFETKAKAEAEQAKLNPWNKGHPEHGKFRSLMERADFSRRMLANAQTPEEQATAKKLMSGQFSPEEIKSLEQAEQDRKSLLADFTADPRGFLTENVRDLVQAQLREYDEFMSARSQVQGIVSDPNNVKLIESYAPEMTRMMDPQVPAREKAFEHAKLLAEVAALRAQVGQKAEQVAAEEARQIALGGHQPRTAAKRASGQDIGDPVAYLTKKGIPPGHPDHARELLRLNDA